MKLKMTISILLMTICAFAADATGKWKTTVEGPQGQMDWFSTSSRTAPR